MKRLRTVNYIIGNLHLTGMPLQNRMNELVRIEWEPEPRMRLKREERIAGRKLESGQ